MSAFQMLYADLDVTAFATATSQLAVDLLTVILLAVLVIGIRNASDLVTTIAQRRTA